MIFWWIRLRLTLWALRMAGRMLALAALLAVLIAAAPVTVVTALAVAGAWLRGWPAVRLRRAAWWSLPMTAVYLAGKALHAGSWQGLALAPVRDWLASWHEFSLGDVAAAFVLCAPVAVPAGLLAASWVWGWRVYTMETGLSGRTATAPVVFDARQWRRQSQAARAGAAAPGAVPLVDGRGRIVMGTTIRAVGHRWQPVMSLPHTAMGRHQVVIGASGSGKTNLMIRTWAGWHAAAHAASVQHGAPRPLLIVLDCKGGPDSRAKADRTRRLLHATGARRVAIWPDESPVSLWALPARELAVTLFQMIESGTGPAAYYADVMQAVVTLAVTAPPRPPANAAEFLARLEPSWLEHAYGSDPPRLAAVTAARRHLGDISLRYQTLLARLGPALDGPGSLADADAWYFILEGTREQTVAEAQALALVELAAHAATSRDTEPRAILLAADDYSAISGRVPLWQLYERGRSLGIGVQVSAQSWQGLGATEDERYRIAATADGGIWVMRTPYPQPICELAGTRRIVETATKVIGGMWGDEGSSRVQHAWTVDPSIVRSLDVGQAGYIHRGGCTWVHIARPRPSPLPLPAPAPSRRPPVVIPPPAPEPSPDAPVRGAARPGPAALDDVFGKDPNP